MIWNLFDVMAYIPEMYVQLTSNDVTFATADICEVAEASTLSRAVTGMTSYIAVSARPPYDRESGPP